jgi:glycosyltransferase involved in cell wall biosynthesis
MRIALNAWFYDQPTTGSGQYTRNLYAALRQIAPSLELQLVVPHRRGDLAKVWFEQVDFPRAAERMKADIAFVPYWAPPLHSSIPIVTTIHDVIPLALSDYRGGPLQRLYTALVRAGSSAASHILTDSENSRRDIHRLLSVDERRLSVVPLAADSRFSPVVTEGELARVRQQYDLPDNYVLYLGGFDRRKNIETLMQVYVWASATIGKDFPLVITGDSSTLVYTSDGQRMTLADMRQALELEPDEVRFIGRVAEDDKAVLCAAARCLLFTSQYEGFGLPALEAISSGTPVVGSNASSIPEVVGDAGMLVDPSDARLMAGAVIAICTDDNLYTRLRQASILRSAQFSWQRTALETLSVFKRVVNGTQRNR